MRTILAGFSALYKMGAGVQKKRVHKKGAGHLPGFVLSIGNLTVGGTGKTPATLRVAEWAREEGYRPAILSRGYGGRHRKGVLDVTDGERVFIGPELAGDEPYLLARNLSGVPVCVSKDRAHAGLHAFKKHQIHFFILDDGFQHVGLHRDFDLVLLDGENPLGNGHLLPWGPLREPVEALKRADALVITRIGQTRLKDRWVEPVLKKFPETPVFFSDHFPSSVHIPKGSGVFAPEYLKGKRVVAFTGIARPESFKKTLLELGVALIFFKGFPDHYPFSRKDIEELVRQKTRLKGDLLITTEKDWVRMESIPSCPVDLAYLTIRFGISSGEDLFFKMIKDKVAEVQRGKGTEKTGTK
jgi:tetraacyldisaccharide 4'-kinase